jgi:hypothetical protein
MHTFVNILHKNAFTPKKIAKIKTTAFYKNGANC